MIVNNIYLPIRTWIASYFTFGPEGPNNGERPWPDKMTSGAVNSGQLYKNTSCLAGLTLDVTD